MTIYITERHLPGVTLHQFRTTQQAALASSERYTAAGKVVHYLRSICIPGDDQILCLFEANDPTHVRDVNEAAGLPFTRIVEALELIPTASGKPG